MPARASRPPPSRSTPLRQQLMLLTILGLLPLALLGGLVIRNAVEQQRHELSRSTIELSRALASAVESELDATVSALAALARAGSFGESRLAAFHEQARNELAVRPEWTRIVLSDGRGTPLVDTARPLGSPPAEGPDPESMTRALATGTPAAGSIRQSDAPVFAVQLPVSAHHRITHVITAEVKPDRVLNVLVKQQVPQPWAAAVVDGSGRRVARSRDHAASVGKSVGPTLMELMSGPQPSGGGITVTRDGVEVYTGYTRLPGYGWTVAVGAPTAQTRAALAGTLAWYAAGILLSIIGCAYVAHRIARRVTLDIHALREQALQLGEHNAAAPKASRIREVEEMGAALHAASQRLHEASTSLREALARAESSGRIKDEFLAMLGHELRNPLAPMLTALHLMDLRPDPATARSRQILRRQLVHMQSLVDDLLDVSRITAGKFRVRSDAVDLREVVERCVETVQPALQDRREGIELAFAEIPLWVRGDQNRLVQALTNLLTNALRFCPEGRVALSVQAEAGTARIRVADDGVGMERQTLEQVFDPFFQAGQTIERSSGGLGLGLAIVHGIVELHGGKIKAHSEGLGRGCTFEITLPLIEPPCATTAPEEAFRPARHGRVLLVDDNVDALHTMAEILRLAGHEVRAASHPRDALALLTDFSADVAIYDIGLPDMDGYQLAKESRRARPGWAGGLVALTGYGQATDKARAAAAGFDVHLTKPVEPAQLLNTVEALLGAIDGAQPAPQTSAAP